MGVDHSFAAGYGVVLTYEDITTDLIKTLEYFPSYSSWKSHEEWATEVLEEYEDGDLAEAARDYNGNEDVIEFICKKYGLNYATAGSSYSGELCWLVGEVTSGGSNDYWFEEVAPDPVFTSYDEVNEKLATLKADLGLNLKVSHYAGMHVY